MPKGTLPELAQDGLQGALNPAILPLLMRDDPMVIDQSNSLQKSYNFDVLQDICSSRVETANFFLGIYESLGDGYDVERQFYQEQISQYKLYDV